MNDCVSETGRIAGLKTPGRNGSGDQQLALSGSAKKETPLSSQEHSGVSGCYLCIVALKLFTFMHLLANESS
jgi:hypothetical protein